MRTASANSGKFLLGIGKQTTSSVEYVEADYLLIASGNSSQVGKDKRGFPFSSIWVKFLSY